MAHPDTTFCLFFRSHPEAATLACDEIGVTYDELLYLPEPMFIASAPTPQVGLLQYNLRERQRQTLFRKLFEARQSIIAGNNVQQRWEERGRLFPNAPPPPNVNALVKAAKEHHKTLGLSQTDGFDTESEDDDLDELYRPKPTKHHNLRGNSNITGSSSVNARSNNNREGIRSPTQSHGGTQSRMQSPSRLQSANSPLSTSSLTIFPQPPNAPPPVPTRTNENLPQETQLVKLSKQRLRNFTKSYVENEKTYLETKAGGRPRTSDFNLNSFRQTSGSVVSRESGGDSSHHYRVGGSLQQSPMNATSIGGTSIAPATALFLESMGTYSARSNPNGPPTLCLPAVPDAGKTTQKELRNLLAMTLVDVIDNAGLQQRANEASALGAAREKRGEYTLNTIRNEYADTPSPGFGLRGANSPRNRQWMSKRENLQAHRLQVVENSHSTFNEKWAKKAEKIQATEAEKMNPHKVLGNEAGKVRQLLNAERKEGIDRAKEMQTIQNVSRRSPRHLHAEEVREAKKSIAQHNRDAHEQLKLYRLSLKDEQHRMILSKQFGVPAVVNRVWNSDSDTLCAPAMGVQKSFPSRLNQVVERAVSTNTASSSGAGKENNASRKPWQSEGPQSGNILSSNNLKLPQPPPSHQPSLVGASSSRRSRGGQSSYDSYGDSAFGVGGDPTIE